MGCGYINILQCLFIVKNINCIGFDVNKTTVNFINEGKVKIMV